MYKDSIYNYIKRKENIIDSRSQTAKSRILTVVTEIVAVGHPCSLAFSNGRTLNARRSTSLARAKDKLILGGKGGEFSFCQSQDHSQFCCPDVNVM